MENPFKGVGAKGIISGIGEGIGDGLQSAANALTSGQGQSNYAGDKMAPMTNYQEVAKAQSDAKKEAESGATKQVVATPEAPVAPSKEVVKAEPEKEVAPVVEKEAENVVMGRLARNIKMN